MCLKQDHTSYIYRNSLTDRNCFLASGYTNTDEYSVISPLLVSCEQQHLSESKYPSLQTKLPLKLYLVTQIMWICCSSIYDIMKAFYKMQSIFSEYLLLVNK